MDMLRTSLNETIIVFAKEPVMGRVKSRLGKTLGMEWSMHIYTRLLEYTLTEVMEWRDLRKGLVALYISPESSPAYFKQWKRQRMDRDATDSGESFWITSQSGSDLGERMERSFSEIFSLGAGKAVLIGTDCPNLDARLIDGAFRTLSKNDIVIGPASDGGYYLIGMRRSVYSGLNGPLPLFRDIHWSSSEVFEKTVACIRTNKWSYAVLPLLYDIDEERDLERFMEDQAVSSKRTAELQRRLNEEMQKCQRHITKNGI